LSKEGTLEAIPFTSGSDFYKFKYAIKNSQFSNFLLFVRQSPGRLAPTGIAFFAFQPKSNAHSVLDGKPPLSKICI